MKWKLLCNDFPAPSGTDGAPWFSWRLESPTVPDHWRVRVFDASHKILWDAQTDRPMGEYLIYNGQLLASMTRYFWQVQTVWKEHCSEMGNVLVMWILLHLV